MSKGIRREKEGEVKQEYKNKILNLIESRGRATFKELLDALGISKPALSKYLKELEQEGLITWQRNLEDRRSGFYITTEKFKKSEYYREKVMALTLFAPVATLLNPVSKCKECDEFSLEKIIFHMGLGFFRLAMAQHSTGKPLGIAFFTYWYLVAHAIRALAEIDPKIGEELKKSSRESYEKLSASEEDIDRLLEKIYPGDEKLQRLTKEVIFSL